MKTKIIALVAGVFCMLRTEAQSYVAGFNGTSQYVNLGNAAFSNIRTIEFWFSPTGNISAGGPSAGDITLMRRNYLSLSDLSFMIKKTGLTTDRGYLYFSVRLGATGYEIRSNANSWTGGQWYHVCGVLDAANGMSLYINGEKQTQVNASATGGLTSSTTSVYLGCKPGVPNSNYFAGKIDEVKIWNRTLTADEIAKNRCACINADFDNSLKGYWKFEEGSGTTSQDATDYDHDATVSASWVAGNLFATENVNCPRKNEFKIGLMAGGSYYHTDLTKTIDLSGYPTSTLNQLKKDGINIVHDYAYEINEAWLADYLNFLKLHGVPYLGNFKEFFRSTTPGNGAATGSPAQYPYPYPDGGNEYDSGDPTHNAAMRGAPDFDNIIQTIFANPGMKETVWGVQSNEEAAYCHGTVINSGGSNPYPGANAERCGYRDATWYSSEIPADNVTAARIYFDTQFDNLDLDTKIISMEAPHGAKPDYGWTHYEEIPGYRFNKNGYSSIVASPYITNMSKTRERDVFLEGSYINFSMDNSDPDHITDGWASSGYFNPTGGHYLNKYYALDYANDYAREIHSVISVNVNEPRTLHTRYGDFDANNDGTVENYGHYTPIKNADYLWFQAYNSIVHGVNGVWFYSASQFSDKEKQQNPNWQTDLVNNHFDVNYFPPTYKNFTRYLIQELAWLKNNGFLTNDNSSVIGSSNEGNDDVGIITSTDPVSFDPILSPTAVQNFYDYNSLNLFEPRYTIRTNGEDVILILVNQYPFGLDVELDFSCINNEIIKNSTGVEMLFTEETYSWSAMWNYKINRNLSTINLQNNTLLVSAPILYNSGTKSFTAHLGSLDAVVYRFKKGTIPANPGTNGGWDNVWTNHGNGKLDLPWTIGNVDYYYPGDFDGDGKKNDMVCASESHNWIKMLHYDGTEWKETWTNYGNYGTALWAYRSSLIVGDFDGNGRDDLLGNLIDGNENGPDCNDGRTSLFMFYDNDWRFVWTDNGCGSHPIRAYKDRLVPMDFDGNGTDGVIGFNNPSGWIVAFSYVGGTVNASGCRINGNFQNGWSSYDMVSHYSVLAQFRYAPVVAGDFLDDGSQRDQLVCFGQYPNNSYVNVINWQPRLDNGVWDFISISSSAGWMDNWALPLNPGNTKVMVGNVDTDDPVDEVILIGEPGYMSSFTLQPNLTWEGLWWATPASGGGTPNLDDWYIPGQGDPGNPYSSWMNANFFSTFDHASSGSPQGILAIRKSCLGLASLYAGNTIQKDMMINPEEIVMLASNGNDETLDFNVYPNPSSGTFNVVLDASREFPVSIVVQDLIGRNIRTIENLSSYRHEIDLSVAGSGVYIVKVSYAGKTIVKRIVRN